MRVDTLYLFDFGFEVFKNPSLPLVCLVPCIPKPRICISLGTTVLLVPSFLVAKSAYVAWFREHGQGKIKMHG